MRHATDFRLRTTRNPTRGLLPDLSWLAVWLAPLALSGCAGVNAVAEKVGIGELNLAEYAEVSMQNAARMPSEADLNKPGRTKVVVFPAEAAGVTPARAMAERLLAGEIEQLLGNNGIEVVDRSVDARLAEEIKAIESRGAAVYEGPAVAHFAVKPLTPWAEQVSRQVVDKRKEGKPPEYEHSAKVNLSVQVYSLPSLNQIKVLSGRGETEEKDERPGSPELAENMMRASIQKAMRDSRVELLNLFAPKGYVTGKREKNGKPIFRISIGSQHGLEPRMPVRFYTEQESINPINNKPTYDRVPLFEGVVSKLVSPGEAWVVPDSADKARQVRLGDPVDVIFKDSAWDRLSRPIRKLTQ